MIMGLFNKKKTVQPVKEEALENGELPWGWITKHEAFTKPIMDKQKEYIAAWVNAPLGSFEKKEALSKYLHFLLSTQSTCEIKGECYSKWFSDIVADQKQIIKLQQELSAL